MTAWPYLLDAAVPNQRSALDRLTSKSRPDLARRALPSLLTEADLSTRSRHELNEVFERYGLSLSERAELRAWAYRVAVAGFTSAAGIAAVSRAHLDQIRRLLDIGTDEAFAIHEEGVKSFYDSRISATLEMPFPQRSQIAEFCAAFAFDEADGRRRERDVILAWGNAALEKARLARRLTGNQYAQRTEAMAALGITMGSDEFAVLYGAYQAWCIESGAPLEPINADIVLRKNERCYASLPSVWIEQGSAHAGTLYLTTLRIVFSAPVKSAVVLYTSIVAIDRVPGAGPFDKALGGSFVIKKTTGKMVFVQLPALGDVFYLTFARLVRGDIAGSATAARATIKATARVAPISNDRAAGERLDEIVSEYEKRSDESR